MAMLQTLDKKQADQVLMEAAQRHVPVTVTARASNRWMTLHSRLVTVREGRVYLEYPTLEGPGSPPSFPPAEEIGVGFKLKHYKHMFASAVGGAEAVQLPGGEEVRLLTVESPASMQRLQRRAYIRVEVPRNRILRASFWLGGQDAEPQGASPENPVWTGRVMDLSAGGFQLCGGYDAARAMETGSIVGVRLAFGAAEETVYMDAQFRHAQPDGDVAQLGFQFITLTHTQEGHDALQVISAKVAEFQRLAE